MRKLLTRGDKITHAFSDLDNVFKNAWSKTYIHLSGIKVSLHVFPMNENLYPFNIGDEINFRGKPCKVVGFDCMVLPDFHGNWNFTSLTLEPLTKN